jgi:hypothetical protein
VQTIAAAEAATAPAKPATAVANSGPSLFNLPGAAAQSGDEDVDEEDEILAEVNQQAM